MNYWLQGEILLKAFAAAIPRTLPTSDASHPISTKFVVTILQAAEIYKPRHAVLGHSMRVFSGNHNLVFYETKEKPPTVLISIDGRGFLEVTDPDIRTPILNKIAKRNYIMAGELSSLDGEVEKESETEQTSMPDDFLKPFHVKSIFDPKTKSPPLRSVVQVGWLGPYGKTGELIRIERNSRRATYIRLTTEGTHVVFDGIITKEDMEFQQLLDEMICSAPTHPIGDNEGIAISHQMDGESWLFEHIDGFGNRISQVTFPDLLPPFKTRDHTKLRKAFEGMTKYIIRQKPKEEK